MSPSSQERVFRKGYAAELFRIAESDLGTVEYLRAKALKAALVHREIPVPMVHDLGVLLAKVPRECEPPFGYEIGALTEFAAARRYEEFALEWGLEEAQEALGLGTSAVDWAKVVIAQA